jgi:hypothetical protein
VPVDAEALRGPRRWRGGPEMLTRTDHRCLLCAFFHVLAHIFRVLII